jgi:hypothetical protein
MRGQVSAEPPSTTGTTSAAWTPDLASVLDALRTRERQRATLRAELDGLRLRDAGQSTDAW